MFFTQEDYRKIEKWLLANSVKDTEFAGASLPLKGNETVAFVQNGKNVNVLLKDLIEQIFLLGVSDFLNVTDKYGESRISLTQAIQLIPYKSRKIGQVITFLDEDGEWKLFQFQGERVNQWNNATLWVDLIKRIQVISIIDSEDITATVDNLNQTSLTFADKNYNTTDYSGLGRVYLRKNIQSVVNPNTGITYSTNLLTQQMLNKENTIYVLQYDYSLNYQTISIPEGSILVFEGGDINNGTLNCNSTIIVGKFRGNATIAGTYSFQDAQADEEDITQSQSSVLKFKNKGYDEANFSGLGRTYLRKNIVNGVNVLTQDMINNPNTIYHIQYDYNLNGQTITIPSGCVLLFEGGSISNGSINGVNTIIHTTSDNIFKDIIITGLWKNKEVYSSWIHSNKNEANVLFSNLINLCSNDGCTLFITGDYLGKQIKSEPNGGILLLKDNIHLILNGSITMTPNGFEEWQIINCNDCNNVTIEGDFILIGDRNEHDYTSLFTSTHEWGYCISILRSSNIKILGGKCIDATGDGVALDYVSKIEISNMSISSCRRQGISIMTSENVHVSNCVFTDITGVVPGASIDIEPNLHGWARNILIENITAINCTLGVNTHQPGDVVFSNINIRGLYIKLNDDFKGVWGSCRYGLISSGSIIIENIVIDDTSTHTHNPFDIYGRSEGDSDYNVPAIPKFRWNVIIKNVSDKNKGDYMPMLTPSVIRLWKANYVLLEDVQLIYNRRIVDIENSSNITINNFNIKSNESRSNFIEVRNSSDVTIKNSKFTYDLANLKPAVSPVVLWVTGTDSYICDNIKFLNNNLILKSDRDEIVFPYELRASYCSNIYISNNIIEAPQGKIGYVWLLNNNVSEVLIENNKYNFSPKDGILNCYQDIFNVISRGELFKTDYSWHYYAKGSLSMTYDTNKTLIANNEDGTLMDRVVII